jgi:hypothetical protein
LEKPFDSADHEINFRDGYSIVEWQLNHSRVLGFRSGQEAGIIARMVSKRALQVRENRIVQIRLNTTAVPQVSNQGVSVRGIDPYRKQMPRAIRPPVRQYYKPLLFQIV